MTMTPRIRLAAPSSHVVQLVLASLPLFAVFVFFLYEAITRPFKPIYRLNDDIQDDVTVKQAYADTGALIALIDMIPFFLVFEGLWLWLCVHCLVFIPKRRALMKSYLDSGETSLGDVVYKESGFIPGIFCRRVNYATIEYTYPNSSDWWIKKQVRVYERFSREKVTIVRLLNRPFSGQPLSDVEIDVQASSDSRNESNVLACISFAWATFCLAGATLVYYQMTKLNRDEYEDAGKAKCWLIAIGYTGLPVVVTISVFVRWVLYQYWIVSRGKVYKDDDSVHSLGTAEFERMRATMLSDIFS